MKNNQGSLQISSKLAHYTGGVGKDPAVIHQMIPDEMSILLKEDDIARIKSAFDYLVSSDDIARIDVYYKQPVSFDLFRYDVLVLEVYSSEDIMFSLRSEHGDVCKYLLDRNSGLLDANNVQTGTLH